MKKGFTLVELLAVIVIIGLLALVAYPAILRIISDSKNSSYNTQVALIEKAAKEWAVEHPMNLPDISDPNCSKCIMISQLTSEGYLSKDEITNPKGGTFNGGVKVSCASNKYEYQYQENCS